MLCFSPLSPFPSGFNIEWSIVDAQVKTPLSSFYALTKLHLILPCVTSVPPEQFLICVTTVPPYDANVIGWQHRAH